MTWIFSKAMMEACESLPSSPEPVAESSEESCSDGEPYAQLNVKPTQHKFWRNDKMIDHSNLSRFGLTLRVLTDDHGEAVLMSFLAAFPVRTSALQGRGQASLGACDQSSGSTKPGLLAKYDPDTHTLRTAQRSLIEDSMSSSVTLPRWGTLQDGAVYQAATAGPFTSVTDFGYSLPTIVKAEHKGTSTKRYKGSPHFRGAKMCEGLRICETDPAYLNPSFAEIVMGWPLGWTELAPLETGRFQEWQQQHSIFCKNKCMFCEYELDTDDAYGCPNCEAEGLDY